MRRYRLTGGTILTPAGWAPADLAIDGDRIARLDDTAVVPEVPLDGLLVAPGFVDLQINGAFSHDFTAQPEGMWQAGRRLPTTGVTGFLPTIVSGPPEVVTGAQRVWAAGPPPGYRGAIPLGLHLEGPMLAPARRGAHQLAYLRPPSLDLVADWRPAIGVRLVTLAPELPGALETIEVLAARGVVVSLGHSDATAEVAGAALEAGATMGTHLFNAMSGVDQRQPGLATALMARLDIAVGLIADGVHLHPEAVRLAWAVKGPHHLALVTDAMASMGVGPGRYPLGPTQVMVGEEGPRTADGRLAGSVLSMDEALRNLIAFTGCEPAQALSAVAATPARLLGDDLRGSLRPGSRADLVVLDGDLTVVATVVGGEPVHDPKGLFTETAKGYR